jgi:hypothetical protein
MATRYALHVSINRLDGTTVEEKDNELRTKIKLLDAIAHELQKHEDFASSVIFTVVANRAPEVE